MCSCVPFGLMIQDFFLNGLDQNLGSVSKVPNPVQQLNCRAHKVMAQVYKMGEAEQASVITGGRTAPQNQDE